MRFPTIRLAKIWHVGTMDPAQLGRNSGSGSLEGRCLSVSVCPNAWEAIARLGGNALHELTRPEGEFIDVLALLKDPDARADVMHWAAVRGLVEERTLWRGWSADEDGDWRYMTFETRGEAVEELLASEMLDGEDELGAPDGHEAVEPIRAVVGTPELARITGIDCPPGSDASDAAVMAWAMLALPEAGIEVDGLWWNEDLDETALSAPRGCVFPGRVAGWERTDADMDEVDDWDEVDAMPEAEWVEIASPGLRP